MTLASQPELAPELVVLFADADAERFVSTLLRRGMQSRCLRELRAQSVRDPMRDPKVARSPNLALAAFLHLRSTRFLVVWDHVGSGREREAPGAVEQDVVSVLVQTGLPRENVAAVAFVPELEIALVPVWDRVMQVLAQKRSLLPPAAPPRPDAPKESLHDALRELRLRPQPCLFEELAAEISVARLKNGEAISRMAAQLVTWFGASA